MPNYCYLDFEFCNTQERTVTLVCCSLRTEQFTGSYWLYPDKAESFQEMDSLVDELQYLHSLGYTFVSFGVEAEARSFISLNLVPYYFKWIDLHIEWKMLLNHNSKYINTTHIINGKKVVVKNGLPKPSTSLVSCLYALLDVEVDSKHKDEMRDLILSSPGFFEEEERSAILDYCASDVRYLPRLLDKFLSIYKSEIPGRFQDTIYEEMLLRGDYSARTAVMVSEGYPINKDWAYNLASNVPVIYQDIQRDINEQFPDVMPFRWDKAKCNFVMNTKNIKAWIEAQGFSKWKMTDGGTKGIKDYSLALDAWEDHFSFRHTFPRNNFGAQMVRYLKTKQSLNSFNIKETSEDTFFDFIGSDGYVRPYMNHYGAQSSRSQPSSTSFLFLKGAWCRAICQPPEDYYMVGIDYSSQEFLLAAIFSEDEKMWEAYVGGDPYLYFGKGIGLIPPEGTKQTHSHERDLCKGTVLGLSYLMTKIGLARKLTNDTGKPVSEDEAQKLVTSFEKLFSKSHNWKQKLINAYIFKSINYVRLLDGYYMFGDNPNPRSVGNVPLQGAGACIMRKAVQLAQDDSVSVRFTNHDALYAMVHKSKLHEIDSLYDSMYDAFIYFFEDKKKEYARSIRMDIKMWGPGLEKGKILTPKGREVETSLYHIDPRAKEEFEKYYQYFLTNNDGQLL